MILSPSHGSLIFLSRLGETVDFDVQTLPYPEIKIMYWAGGNPFHHHKDLGHLVAPGENQIQWLSMNGVGIR